MLWAVVDIQRALTYYMLCNPHKSLYQHLNQTRSVMSVMLRLYVAICNTFLENGA